MFYGSSIFSDVERVVFARVDVVSVILLWVDIERIDVWWVDVERVCFLRVDVGRAFRGLMLNEWVFERVDVGWVDVERACLLVGRCWMGLPFFDVMSAAPSQVEVV